MKNGIRMPWDITNSFKDVTPVIGMVKATDTAETTYTFF